MSNRCKEEDNGLQHKKSCYTTLSNTYEYYCPYENSSYIGINNGVNCLCVNPIQRSSMDNLMKNKNWSQSLPVTKNIAGWK